MDILEYLVYILKCIASLTAIIFLFSIIINTIRNDKYEKQKRIIEIQKMICEVNKNIENQDK
jgi:hypothetical protein